LVALDIELLKLIMQMIIELIKFLQNWKFKPGTALERAKNPGFFASLILKGKIRGYLKNTLYEEHVDKMFNSLVEVARQTNEIEMVTLFSEVQ
jgi:hypothetical protein